MAIAVVEYKILRFIDSYNCNNKQGLHPTKTQYYKINLMSDAV